MHIYLVEIENYARGMVAEHLQSLGHRICLLSTPAELLGALAADPEPTDLIIADLQPAGTRATSEALRLVHRRYPTIPVVLRVSSEVLSATDAVHCGVHGYLSKPFRAAELELLLIRLAERQTSHCFQDADSGLYHRAGFAAMAQQQLRSARRTKTRMVLVRADVGSGDLEQTERAIGDLGHVVQRTFRDADMAGRVDGTDCGVLLVNADAGQTEIALTRLEQNLAAHNARAGHQLHVRVGVAHFDPDQPSSFEQLVARADAESSISLSKDGASRQS